MTIDTFRAQMARLGGLKFAPADLTTHWEDLSDLPDDVLKDAITFAQRTRIDFPTPRELRQDADQVRASRPAPEEPLPPKMPAPVFLGVLPNGKEIRAERVWNYYCEDCKDTGWQSVWCGDLKAPQRKPWHEPRTCDRRGEHMPHEWVRHCVCYDTNPHLVKKREAAQKFTDAPAKVSR